MPSLVRQIQKSIAHNFSENVPKTTITVTVISIISIIFIMDCPIEYPNAITLNNHGAWSIKCKNYDYAIKILSAAIKTLRSENNKTMGSPRIIECNLHHFMANNNQRHNDDTDGGYNYKIGIEANHDTQETTHHHPYQHRKQRFMYQHPIEIPSWYSKLPGYQSNTTVTTAIIFNLALAHHLYGVSMETTTEQDGISSEVVVLPQWRKSILETAATLYEQALVMNWTKCEEDAWAPQFLLATLNNLGQLFHTLDDGDRSDKWYLRLLQYLMLFTDLKVGTWGDLEGFFASVSHLIFRESSVPAAAA